MNATLRSQQTLENFAAPAASVAVRLKEIHLMTESVPDDSDSEGAAHCRCVTLPPACVLVCE